MNSLWTAASSAASFKSAAKNLRVSSKSEGLSYFRKEKDKSWFEAQASQSRPCLAVLGWSTPKNAERSNLRDCGSAEAPQTLAFYRMRILVKELARFLELHIEQGPNLDESKQIAKVAAMGMIFIPSRDGISHSPKEFTSWQDVANAAEVLYRVVLLLDDRLNRN